MAHRITVDQARPFWADPSQHVMGSAPDTLPDEGFEYWADGPVCVVFHLALWPGVWMAHYGMKREGLGHYVEPAKRILHAFWAEKSPARIIGWTDASNRAAVAFAGRCGFTKDGEIPTDNGSVLMTGWRP
ncbi:hypothetical protein [Loktanella sp. R86503]|uniref:hypothetical protein n=1 Tax=Loktanella sp. R86503 TaxID=3093847 RepID=UPI0036DBA4CA